MEQILEYLVPVIVILFWVLSRFFQRNPESDADESTPPAASEDRRDAHTDDEQRGRTIQDEIRRKIAERRSEATASASERHRPEAPPPPLVRHSQDDSQTFPPPVTSSTDPQFLEIPQPGRNIQAELAQKRREIEETRKKADAARKQRLTQARQNPYAQSRQSYAQMNPYAQGSDPDGNPITLNAEVLASLYHPYTARKAVLLYEIIGTPVGLRENGLNKPSWNQ